MASVYKRGPKRKEGARHKSGNLIQKDDYGTPDLRLKRDIAAGVRSIPAEGKLADALGRVESSDKPPTRTGTDALDILLARRIIDRDQFETALDFCACWCVVFGRPWPKGWQAERQSPDYNGGVSESYLERMKVRYWNCLAAMDQDRTVYPLVRDLVIHGKLLGLIEDLIDFDVVRQADPDDKNDGLVGRKGVLPPSLRFRIGRLTKGISIIADAPHKDYTREALAMVERIREREPKPLTSC